MTICKLIHKNHDEIVKQWTQEARRAASARGLTTPEFENVLPRNLFAIADASPSELGQLSGARRELIENHFSARLRQGFDLAEIIEEIAILGRTIRATWELARQNSSPAPGDIQKLFDELNVASSAVAECSVSIWLRMNSWKSATPVCCSSLPVRPSAARKTNPCESC